MLRVILLTYWEIRRLLRARAAIASVLTVPIVGIILHILMKTANSTLLVTITALTVGAVLVYTRLILDRASGFAVGLESTPSAGAIVIGARILTCLVAASVQIVIFSLISHFIG